MATKCGRRRYPTRRGLSSTGGEVSTTYNLRKKRQLQDDSSVRNASTIVESKGKCKLTYGGKSENTSDYSAKKTSSSLKFTPLSQDRLKQIYQQERYRPDSLKFKQSEEEDEDDVPTVEQLKTTEGYKLIIKGLDAMLGKPQS